MDAVRIVKILLFAQAMLVASAVAETTFDSYENLDLVPITTSAPVFTTLYPNQDPHTKRLLKDSINRVAQLINSYKQDGLLNMPNLPDLPGLHNVMHLPDKVLRAELSMLQDEIRMAQEMMRNPVMATINLPKDLAAMMTRILTQLKQ